MTRELIVAGAVLALCASTALAQGGGQATTAPRAGAGSSSDSAAGKRVPLETDEDGQPRNLPALPSGMTLQMIRQGDSLYHGKGGCFTCHDLSGTGMPARGSGITTGLAFIPIRWQSIDSLIVAGLPESVTRTPIAMPPRGAASNLTPEESRLIAAYVWAIATVQGEPWRPGGRTRTRAAAGADTTARP